MSRKVDGQISSAQPVAAIPIAEFIAEAVAAVLALQIMNALEAVIIKQENRNFDSFLKTC
ncbi:hypothetical protein D3C87_2197680 [compost metagenome]